MRSVGECEAMGMGIPDKLTGGGSAAYEVGGMLRDLEVEDARQLAYLVQKNADELSKVRPDVRRHFGLPATAGYTIGTALRSPSLAELGLFVDNEEDAGRRLIGQVSMRLAKLSCGHEIVLPYGVRLSVWLDKAYQERGIEERALNAIALSQRFKRNKMHPHAKTFTFVDPASDAAVYSPLKSVGKPQDYTFAGQAFLNQQLLMDPS